MNELISPTYVATMAGAKQFGEHFSGISPLVLFIKWVVQLTLRQAWCLRLPDLHFVMLSYIVKQMF